MFSLLFNNLDNAWQGISALLKSDNYPQGKFENIPQYETDSSLLVFIKKEEK